MNEVALCAAIGMAAGTAGPPQWLHLLPAGEVRTIDGRGPYRITDRDAIVAASMAGGKLVLDENHATDLAAPRGSPAPARGWIVQLHNRVDGIWGRVDWTESAKRAELWRSYRGVSPAIVHRKDGTISSITRASLTNTPNLSGLTTLHAQGDDIMLRAALAELLDLPASADDRMVINKVAMLVKQHTGKDVALQSTPVEVQQLSLQASAYQAKFAGFGLTIDFATAVRAVQEGAR